MKIKTTIYSIFARLKLRTRIALVIIVVLSPIAIMAVYDVSAEPDPPVAYWNLDQNTDGTCPGGADACDGSGNDNNLANTNAVWQQSEFCVSNNCMSLDGTADLTVADSTSLSITGDLSVSLWIRPNELTASTIYFLTGKASATSTDYAVALFGDEVRMYVGSTANYETTNSANLQVNNYYQITAAYDASGQSVDIYINGVLQPSTTTGTIPASISDTANSYSVGQVSGGDPETFDQQISADANDGFESGSTWFLNFGGYDFLGSDAADGEKYALHFTNITIPQGATITDAELNWYVGGSGFNNTANIDAVLRAQDTDDAGTINSGNLPSSWSQTTAGANFDGTASWNFQDLKTVTGVAPVIQEIVDRGGWASGNDINLVLEDRGTTPSDAFTSIFDYTEDPDFAGELHIEYTPFSPYQAYEGFIDEIKVYGYTRSNAEAKTDSVIDAGPRGASTVLGAEDTAFLNFGLAGYWEMDEAAWDDTPDQVIDSSGNNNNGTSEGTATTSSLGKFNRAGIFDGTDGGNVDILDSTSLDISQAVTIATWVNADNPAGGDAGLFRKDGGYQLLYINDGTITGRAFDCTGVNYATPIATDTWVHVAWTYDGNRNVLYINGQKVAESLEDCAIPLSDDNAQIGVHDDEFDGMLDDLRLYSRVLSGSEISSLYNWAPGPEGYWHLNENTGTSAFDSSGNQFTGTLTSSPQWVNGKYGSALTFNGSNNFVDIGAGPTVVNTVGFWTKPTTTTEYFVDLNGSAYISSSSGTISATGFTSPTIYINGIVSSTITAGTWQYITVTTATPLNASDLDIGRIEGVGNMEGNIDEVQLYSYARTQGQIVEDMNGGHPLGGSPIASQVAYWKFDEQQGQAANNSGFGGTNLNGVLGSSSSVEGTDPTWLLPNDCKINGCLDFDGSDDLVGITAPNTPTSGTGDFSIFTWIKTSETGTRQELINYGTPSSNNQMLFFFVNSSNQVEFDLWGDTGPSSSVTVTDDNWHRVGVVNTAGSVQIYIDGRKSGSPDTMSPNIGTSGGGTIGMHYFGPGNGEFNGLIDDFKVYNAALTQAEILIDMNAGSTTNIGVTASPESSQVSGGAGNPPVLYYQFNENTGTTSVVDTSGNGNTGAIQGTLAWVPGKLGSALNFDGANNEGILLSAPSANTEFTTAQSFTIMAWVKIRACRANGSKYVESSSASASILLGCRTNTNLPHFGVGNGGGGNYDELNGTTTINDNQWHHVVGVMNGSTATTYIYVDGVLENSISLAFFGTSDWQNDTYRVGYSADGASREADGIIDEVKVYDYARTQAQIAYDYNFSGPIGWWKLDECTGTTANDASGKGNNGTITIGGSGSQTTVGNCATPGTAWGNGEDGKYNASINLDGTDDYINFGDPASGLFDFDTDQDFSFSFWTNLTDTGAIEGLLGKASGSLGNDGNTGFDIIYRGDTDKRLYFRINDGVTTRSEVSYTQNIAGGWHHVAVTADRDGNATIYIDGKVGASGTISAQNGNLATARNLVFGRRADESNNWHYSGKVDDVRIFNFLLTKEQLQIIMNDGSGARFGPQTGMP